MIKKWTFSQWWNPCKGDCVSIVKSLFSAHFVHCALHVKSTYQPGYLTLYGAYLDIFFILFDIVDILVYFILFLNLQIINLGENSILTSYTLNYFVSLKSLNFCFFNVNFVCYVKILFFKIPDIQRLDP